MPRNASVAPCGPRLTRADLDAGIDLGGRYMLAAQRLDGNFVYEMDWTTGQESPDDNAVRQAGATWGLALLYRETRDWAYRVALDRSLAWWETDGRRWETQRGARTGQLGVVALIGLSLLERLAAPEGLADPAVFRTSLDAFCAIAEAARLPGGGFHGAFDLKAGTYSDPADPYSSGEALLLLARSGLEFDIPDRVARALAWAEEDYDKFVAKPLAMEPDPDLTKGYYQWSSMTWFAFASAGHAPEIWGRRLVEQALWMVDVHRTLARTRNTGYAYEGILPAWEWARRTGDDDTARKLACVVHQGLRKLCSWQLGHPLASEALRSAPLRFHGAVQNHAKEPALRIDVTQHQVHALMRARQFGIDTAEHLCDAAAPVKTEARRYSTAYEVDVGTVPARASPSFPFELEITHSYKGPNILTRQPAVRCEVTINDPELLSSDAIDQAVRRLERFLPEAAERITASQLNDVNWINEAHFNKIRLAEIAAVATFTLMRRVYEWISPVSSGLLENGSGFYLVCEYRRSPDNAKAAAKLALDLLWSAKNKKKKLADFEHKGRRGSKINTSYILEEAELRGIPVSSPLTGWPVLGLGCFQKRLDETMTSETSVLAVKIAQDKVRTADVLRQAGVPVPQQITTESKAEAIAAANRIGYPVVVKPIDGSQGRGVSVKLMSEAAVASAFEEAAARSDRVIVESYIAGSDYRLLVVNGEFVAACQRVPGHVVGNGTDTIKRLLEVLNSDPRRNGDLMYPIKFDFDAQRMLEEQGLTLESIPDDGRIVFLRSKGNTSAGGTSVGVTERVHPDNRRLAITAARALQLDVAGIDLITSDITRSYKETKGGICEINSRPGIMDLHVYPAAGSQAFVAPYMLDMLFPRPSTGRVPIVAICGDYFDDRLSHSVAHLLQMAGHEVALATHEGLWVGGDLISNMDSANFDGARRALLHPSTSAAVIEVTTESLLSEGLGFDFADVVVITNNFCKLLTGKEQSTNAANLIGSSGGALVLGDDVQVAKDLLSIRGQNRIYLTNHPPVSPPDEKVIRIIQSGKAMVRLEASGHESLIALPAIGESARQIVLAIAACHAIGISPGVIEDALKAKVDSSQSEPLLISGLATPFGRILIATPRNRHDVEAISEIARSWAAPQSPDIVIHMSFEGDPDLQAALDAQLQTGSARVLERDSLFDPRIDLLSFVLKGADRRVVILTDSMEFFRNRLGQVNRTLSVHESHVERVKAC